ncbi:MAG: hypothetical protein LBR10_12645 [Prevotellaceae bacterium]|jgi:hypothetical protein|nr:hypothetical protein [Prevotellaceae bacterium]
MTRIGIIAVVLWICLVSCSDKVKVKTDYEKLNLKGNIKNITEIYFLPEMSGDTIRRGERTTNETSFFQLDGDDEIFISYETKVYFNHDGNITECTMTDSTSGFYFREVLEYQDKLLQSKQGLLSNNFFYKEIFKYDKKNRETERIFYDSEKHPFESVIREYPDKNTIIELVYTDNEGSNFEKEIRLKDGLPVSSTVRTDSLHVIEKWTGEYDDNGRMIVSKFYNDQNELIQYTKCTYDEFGNEFDFFVYTGVGELVAAHKHRYKYDELNNWTQQVSIINNYPEVIMERNIIYY